MKSLFTYRATVPLAWGRFGYVDSDARTAESDAEDLPAYPAA